MRLRVHACLFAYGHASSRSVLVNTSCVSNTPSRYVNRKESCMSDNLLTTKEAARVLGVSEAFLERDRCYTATIPFIRVGNRAARYSRNDLDTFVRSRVRSSTSDPGRPK